MYTGKCCSDQETLLLQSDAADRIKWLVALRKIKTLQLLMNARFAKQTSLFLGDERKWPWTFLEKNNLQQWENNNLWNAQHRRGRQKNLSDWVFRRFIFFCLFCFFLYWLYGFLFIAKLVGVCILYLWCIPDPTHFLSSSGLLRWHCALLFLHHSCSNLFQIGALITCQHRGYWALHCKVSQGD